MKRCSIDGCDGKHEGLGYCRVHYRRFKKHGTPHLTPYQRPTCIVPDCDSAAKARGLCGMHVRRFYTHGTPMPPVETDEDRFWAKVTQGADDECWEWLGSKHPNGHGYHSVNGRLTYAHRFSLELSLGRRLGQHKFACHHCDNPPCVNPKHLYEGDAKTNSDDMWRRGRANPGGRRPRVAS